jgi:hypothetical protein
VARFAQEKLSGPSHEDSLSGFGLIELARAISRIEHELGLPKVALIELDLNRSTEHWHEDKIA